MKLFGSSGIRAVFDKDLLELACRVGLVVGKRYPNVVIGTDTRTSRDAMKHAVVSGLLASGAQCRDMGVAPTPTVAYVARDFDAVIAVAVRSRTRSIGADVTAFNGVPIRCDLDAVDTELVYGQAADRAAATARDQPQAVGTCTGGTTV